MILRCWSNGFALLACVGMALVPSGCDDSTDMPSPTVPHLPGPVDLGQESGDLGVPDCPGLPSPGLNVTVTLAPPKNGGFFVRGERAAIHIKLANGCGIKLRPSQLGTLSLLLSGPRTAAARAATGLLNAVVDRMAKDHQHHFINLAAPAFADPGQNNLSVDTDGTLVFTTAAVGDEPPGTYTIGVLAKSKDSRDQVLPTLDLQLGSATVQSYATGESPASSCYACHRGSQSGKSYQAHSQATNTPFGNYGLDQAPIASCKLCHNLDGYSPNNLVRRVHGVHRGHAQLRPGAAHPEYGVPEDKKLAEYTNVEFPAMPGGERNCEKCHADGRWKSAVSRSACGACHDNLFFDKGQLDPPRDHGKTCAADADCAELASGSAVCDLTAGSATLKRCVTRAHPPQPDDAACAGCHPAEGAVAPSVAPVSTVHLDPQLAKDRRMVVIASLKPGSGMGGAMVIGTDVPDLTFTVTEQDGAGNPLPVTDLTTAPTMGADAVSLSAVVSGPTDDRKLVYPGSGGGIVALRTAASGTLAQTTTPGTYTFTFASAFPATAVKPLNTSLEGRPNPTGTYTLWLFIGRTVKGTRVRVANQVLHFPAVVAGAAPKPVKARQVITSAACNACHTNVQAHGGSRQSVPTECSACHNRRAVDRTIGASGPACTATDAAACRAYESCRVGDSDAGTGNCVVTRDPTPGIDDSGQTIEFGPMIHSIHFARLRGGYLESRNLVAPGKLQFLGYGNNLDTFADPLLPLDVRNCKNCHADAGGMCSATMPCGVGQVCSMGSCVNTAWQTPSLVVCTSCHDTASAYGHAQINTYRPDGGAPIETCDTCHGPDAEFAVAKVHAITNPYVPPYGREPKMPAVRAQVPAE